MFLRMVYDEKLAQAAYLIGCQRSGEAIVIDPERDVDRYIKLAEENELQITAVAETHIHADFLSGARELAERVGAKVYVSGEPHADCQSEWLNSSFGCGPYNHQRVRDGDTFSIGNVRFQVLHTPGHTPEHISLLVTDSSSGATEPIGIVTGDFLLVGDIGRPELREAQAELAARQLHLSVRRLSGLGDFMQVWPGHGAGSASGKVQQAVLTSTIGHEQRYNPALRAAESSWAFVNFVLSSQPDHPLYFSRMMRDNQRGPALLGDLPAPSKLDPQQLSRLDGTCVAIVDTRSWDAFRFGHLPGSLSLPLTQSFTTDAGSLLRENERIYLVVEPQRLEEAIRDLVRIGLDQIVGWYPATGLPGYAASGGRLEISPEFTAAEARELLKAKQARVLDVRPATECAARHWPGAIRIAHTRLASRIDEVPKDGRLIVSCRNGSRSAQVCAFLRRSGYDAVNLKGGMQAWELGET